MGLAKQEMCIKNVFQEHSETTGLSFVLECPTQNQ